MRMAAEQRNEELSLEISSSTQPLLRQMESLKHSHHQRKGIWERLESELRSRITAMERELNQKEGALNGMMNDLEDAKMARSKWEVQCNRLREEHRTQKARANALTDEMEDVQMKYDDVVAEYEGYKSRATSSEQEVKQLQSQLTQFNRDSESERNRLQSILNSESKKREELQNTITILQSKLRENETVSTPRTPAKDDEMERLSLNRTPSLTPRRPTGTELLLSSIEVNSGTPIKGNSNNMWTVSRIQNELRQKESELESLKQRMMAIQNTNDTFSDEIVKLKSQNESLNKYHALYRNQSKQINALRLRYEAAIDIVMEKEKQIQQLTTK